MKAHIKEAISLRDYLATNATAVTGKKVLLLVNKNNEECVLSNKKTCSTISNISIQLVEALVEVADVTEHLESADYLDYTIKFKCLNSALKQLTYNRRDFIEDTLADLLV